jgi:glycosyltransferase involved in cell wall biosynthesis
MLLVNLSHCLEKPTGITTYALNLIPYLNRLQPNYLSPISLPGEAEQYRISVADDMTAEFGLQGHIKRLWWTQTELPGLAREHEASLLFCPLPEAPRGQQIPFVLTMHDLIPLRFSKPWSPTRLYYRYYLPGLLSEAKHIICNSQATADDVMTVLGCPADKLSVIPLAYDESRFRWLDLPTANYFLCLGRSAPHKNWGRVLAAFAQLPQRSQYELWLVGPTDSRFTPQLMAQAQELGITDRIKVLDFLEPDVLVKVMNQAIALVFPSLWEGFGLPLIEAMACGTPVITSHLSPMAEISGDGALLVDPLRVESISQAMERLIQEEDLRPELRRAGFSNLHRFSQQQMGEATVNILESCMTHIAGP